MEKVFYRVSYWNKKNERSKRDFAKLETALEFANKIKEKAAIENRPICTIIWTFKKADNGDITDLEITMKP